MINTKRPPGSNRIAETSSPATPRNYSTSTARGWPALAAVTTGLLLEKTRSNPNFERLVGPCEINGETIAQDLEPGHNATGSLVQNLRAGFVPPEPPNRTSRYFCDRYGRLGAIACGEAELRYNTLAG